jgi:hypothetical protein
MESEGDGSEGPVEYEALLCAHLTTRRYNKSRSPSPRRALSRREQQAERQLQKREARGLADNSAPLNPQMPQWATGRSHGRSHNQPASTRNSKRKQPESVPEPMAAPAGAAPHNRASSSLVAPRTEADIVAEVASSSTTWTLKDLAAVGKAVPGSRQDFALISQSVAAAAAELRGTRASRPTDPGAPGAPGAAVALPIGGAARERPPVEFKVKSTTKLTRLDRRTRLLVEDRLVDEDVEGVKATRAEPEAAMGGTTTAIATVLAPSSTAAAAGLGSEAALRRPKQSHLTDAAPPVATASQPRVQSLCHSGSDAKVADLDRGTDEGVPNAEREAQLRTLALQRLVQRQRLQREADGAAAGGTS